VCRRLVGAPDCAHLAPVERPLLAIKLARRVQDSHDLRHLKERASRCGGPQVTLAILKWIVVDQPPALGLLEHLADPG
jgi:hypothetical protein